MRGSGRWLVASLCLTVVMSTLGVGWMYKTWAAQTPQGAAEESGARAVQLPIGQVVLFSSGVGYFQREGSVEGDARIDLSFPVSDINDLLKSMVLRDLDGGAISTVSYDSNAPIERTLRSFAVDLTGRPSFADILHQARGEKAEVALANAGAGTLSGTIVGVEKVRQAVPVANGGKEVVEQAQLNLWCSDGMRGVKLSEVQRVRFLNPIIEAEFKKALETLALSHDTQKKSVSIRAVGEGKRRVRVGYVVENPIWKTSYRLVLPAAANAAKEQGAKDEAGKPYLQGWAVVENVSDEDWKDVRMSLVSGRPISFQMDLYQPLFIRRPTVVPELFQGLNPVAYSGRLDGEGKEGRAFLEDEKAEKSLRDMDRAKDSLARNRQAAAKGAAPAAPGRGNLAGFGGAVPGYAAESKKRMEEQLDLGRGVSSAATAAKLGDFFQYAIDRPVTLGRQKSALLPIVGKDVEAKRVSVYNERVQAKFPLLGLKLKNTSGLHLMQGPITVFEGSNYAGDARILDLQPNEERILSYAIDLGTEVSPAPATSNGRITHLKVVKGLLYQTQVIREARVYTMKNRNEQERLVMVEHPVRKEFTLVDSKPAETASDFYRFEVNVPAGQSKTLTVTEERQIGSTVSIRTQGDDQIRFFMSQPVMSEKVKKGLERAMELRLALNKTQREVAELQKQLSVIENDQTRLRANLREMPKDSAAYKRYVKKFDDQETEIEKYQADIKRLQQTQHEQDKVFQDFLIGFSAE